MAKLSLIAEKKIDQIEEIRVVSWAFLVILKVQLNQTIKVQFSETLKKTPQTQILEMLKKPTLISSTI